MDQSAEVVGYEARLSDTVRSLRDMLRRRWLTLILVTGAVIAVGATLIMLMTPKYEAMARLQIDPSRNPLSSGAGDVMASLASEAIETEVTVLSSEDIARRVTQRLKLQNDPEFTRGIAPADGAPLLSAEERTNAVARQVLRNLSVGRDRLTYVINVRFKSRDAEKAARIANGFAEAYIESKVGSRIGTAEGQATFFRNRLNDLAQEVRAADAAVAQYRSQAGIVQGQGSGTIADQQVGPLSSQLATAESEAAEARSNLAAARSQVARGGMQAVSEVRSSPVISDLRRQRAEVSRNMGEISSRYGARHPESIKVQEQLRSLDTQIEEEGQRAVDSLAAVSSAADARVASLRSALSRLEAQQSQNTRAAVTAESLEREAASKRAAYDKTAEMSLESSQAARNEISQATIADRAVPPAKPTSPNRPLLAALTLVVALALGSATIIAQELMVSGIRSVSEFESQFAVPVLAALPLVKATTPADLIVDRPASQFSESLRIARTAILQAKGTGKPKIIALTSALPDEGKTSTTAALARVMAMSGAKTLLIDCDFRRAALRSIVANPNNAPGLVEILSGSASWDQAIIKDRVPGLDVILVNSPHFKPEDMSANGQFKPLLDRLARQYDAILLDLPPLVGLADGRAIATLADATIMVVKWGKTPASPIDAALGWLRSDGANLIGSLFTMVPPSAEAVGGLYYSSKYSAYYQAE